MTDTYHVMKNILLLKYCSSTQHTYEFDEIIEKENPAFKNYNRSNLIYKSKYSFYEYYEIKNFNSLSLS